KIGDTDIKPVHRASCHCGAVELELTLPKGVENPRRCDCSICRRKGAIVASISLRNLTIVKGADKLSLYQFDTRQAKHYFCSVCGIYTHHQRRSHPDQYGINLACLEGVDPCLIGEIPVLDGVNHPSDRHPNSASKA
ncbi:MAG: hypothetical protein ACI8XC_003502, partial [Gammaproteobacteria bacterium]